MPNAQVRSRYRNRIAFYRQAMQMTQEELATVLGVTRTTIARWEVDIHIPSRAMTNQLARVLGCGPRELYPRDFI